MSWQDIATTFSFINFAVAAILGIQYQLDRQKFATFEKFAATLFIIASIGITISFIGHGLVDGWFSSPTKQLGLITLVAAAVIPCFLWLKISPLLPYSAIIATLLTLVHLIDSARWDTIQANPNYPHQIFVIFHVVGALMGEGLALCASIVAVVFLWQQRALKQKLLDELTSRIPSLELLAKILTACMWAGFLFLTAALLSGLFYLDFSPQTSSSEQIAKIIWASLVWSWYLAILVARYMGQLSTKRIAQMNLWGFLLLAITFFGLSFFSLSGGIQ